MPFQRFRGVGPIEGWASPPSRNGLAALTDPSRYQAGDALVRAVNVAVNLSMPLLVTGEPGSGKTQLAYRIAAELTQAGPLRFDTKSSSQANDLFYTFDAMRYFAQSQIEAAMSRALPPAREFVRYQGLGEAILRTLPREEVEELLPSSFADYQPGPSVVLIDEIDKAPRDFPNDLLNHIENREFVIPELGGSHVSANPEFPLVVVITSNTEKQLPDPFLRRCVYHHIELDEDSIMQIVSARLPDLPLSTDGFGDARDFFFTLRGASSRLEKPPSTSELLDWLRALAHEGLRPDRPLREQRDRAVACLGTLVKTEADTRFAEGMLPV